MKPLFIILISFAVLLFPRSSSITSSRGSSLPAGIALELPPGYVALSPLSRTLDSLSLLSNPQSISLFVTLALIVTITVFVRRRRAGTLWKRLIVSLAILVVSLAAIEAMVILLPRAMAALSVSDPAIVTVDFHSHTGASHDVRKSFTAERNREWHRSGGFDIAYVSDHVTFDGVTAGRPMNPSIAGKGTSLLSAVEGRYHRIMSTIMLGLTESDSALLNRRGNLLPGVPASGRAPVTVIALPNRNLDSLDVRMRDSLPGLAAIELIDAAPRGLGQLDREEDRILEIAAELGLIPVAASNNHGWGRTVAAWNLVRVPGWSLLPPDSVGRLIEQALLTRRPDAVTIVERRRPRTHEASLVFTLPVMLHQILGSLTTVERFVWLAWIWSIAVIAAYYRAQRVRTRRGAAA